MLRSRRSPRTVALVGTAVAALGVLVLMAVLIASGVLRGDPALPPDGLPPGGPVVPPTGAGPAPGVATESVRFDFSGALGGGGLSTRGLSEPIPDVAGRLSVRPRQVNGGELVAEPSDTGLAVRFPPRCAQPGAEECPRAILEADEADWLNPGTRDVWWGATVLMTGADTAAGANVVQKGYAAESQFKLQVDGEAGRPSCTVVGVDQPEIYLVVAPVSVADGRWHTIGCSRVGDELIITVDGQQRGSVALPPDLSIVTEVPLRIGGKGTGVDNDQFAGAIDEVYVAIER